MQLGQVETAIQTAGKITDGRSDVFAIGVVVIGLVVFVLWRDSRDRKDAMDRDAKRDEFEANARKEQRKEDQALVARNVEALETIAKSVDRTGQATELMAKTAERTEKALELINRNQEREKKVIAVMIECMEAGIRGDETEKRARLGRAKELLMEA